MTPLSFDTWIELGLKGTAVLGAAAAACFAMRRSSAASRHLVWASAIAAVLALPALSLLVPSVPLPLGGVERLTTVASRVTALVPTSVAARPVSPPLVQPHHGPRTTTSAPSRQSMDPAHASVVVSRAELLVAVWAFGALALLVRLAVALVGAHRVVRAAEPIDDEQWHAELEAAAADLEIERLPILLWAPALSVPMTCGLTRPVILLPCTALTWDVSRMRVVLLHELAHIRRRDCLIHCVAQAALALHWCNPLMWMALARLRAERERACDDLVLVAGTRGSDYAEHLLEIARQFRRQGMEVAAVAMARPSELEGRLLAILDPLRSRRPADRRRLVWAIVAAALVVLPVSGIRLQARAAIPDPATQVAATPTPTPTPSPTPAPTPAPTPTPARARSAAPVLAGVTGGVTGGARGGVAVGVETDADSDQDDAKPDPVADAARENVVKALAGALKDENAGVREQAMQALVQMRSPLAFDPMVAALKDASPQVRHQAAFSLGQMDDARAIPPLVAALRDSDADVRQQAVFALGQLRAREAVPGLIGALADQNADVRQQAAFSLGQLGDPAAIPDLVKALKDTNDDVREQAAFALGQVGDKTAVPGLVQALSDAKPDVRQQAAFALSQIGDASAVDALTTAMIKDTDPEVRQQAAFALGQVFGHHGERGRERKR